jgi:Signal peptidase, peptidase S26
VGHRRCDAAVKKAVQQALALGGYGFRGSELGLEQLGDRQLTMFTTTVHRPPPSHAIVSVGQYFMGANRNGSPDSRLSQVGFIPEANLVDRATRMSWQLPGWPWNRIGAPIR